ncbi:MAG: GGDEF domain-containing protein [Methylophilaceae bacterium]
MAFEEIAHNKIMPNSNQQDMQDAIDFEMVNTYLEQSRISVYSAFLLVIYLAASFYHIAETKNIFLWVLAVFSVDAYIVYSSFQFKNALPSYQISFFRKRQHFLHILAGLAWGSAFMFLLDAKHPLPTDFRLAAVIGVVIAFSASTMSASVRGMVGFVAAVSFLSAIHFLSNFDYFQWWFFALIGLAASCLFFGWMSNKYILGLVESRLLNQTYIDELRTLNDKIEANNQDFIKRNVELQDMQKRLQQLASHDELTGLYNRRFVLERIEEKLPQIRRHQLNFCLMMMDVDHFKNVNDEFGHAAGDDVLRTTAEILTRELRQDDIVARYGGEEFLMLLPMTELSSAELLVERLRSTIEMQSFTFEGARISVTASFGLTQYSREDTADKMIDRADKALYQAKLAGRNCVKVIA